MFYDLFILISTAAALLFGAAVLHLLPRLGSIGRKLSQACCEAPVLDLVVGYFTVAPLAAGSLLGGWRGFASAIAGMLAGMLAWQTAHELWHRESVKGPRIIKVLNRKFGPGRNLTAVYWTALATPVFWFVRMAEIIVYTPLTWLVRLPRYRSSEWISVSRQKFEGLVGHDRIWCLYCDWMTGVWSLATEMLRNVESFWCPIRFLCEKKCANCSIDFPDVNNGWVDARSNMAAVAATVDRMYSPERPEQAWFGHPSRKGVEGKAAACCKTDTVASR